MKKFRSYALLLLTAMIWGLAFVAQRVGAENLRPFTFNGIRFVLGAVSLIPVILLFEKGKTDKKVLRTTLIGGLVAGMDLFIASSLQQFGLVATGSAGKSAFITALYTVLVPLIYFMFGRKTRLFVLIGAVMTAGGMYLLCGVNGESSFGWGDVLLLAGAVFWAFHIIILDYFGDKVRPLRFSVTQFVTCAVLCMVFSLATERDCITLTNVRAALVPLLFGGIGSVGIAYTCQLLGQRGAEPTVASMILCLESVFATIGGAVILHEEMTVAGYIGCALIFCGIVFSQLNFSKK